MYLEAWTLCIVVLQTARAEDEDIYRGRYLGKLNSYHHQVNGEVYAVNEYSFLLRHFVYDGNGPDTFFWAGTTNRPGQQGFLVPNEHGRTNILDRYLDKDITISLPDGKKITDIKWFSVYDLTRRESFGDLYIPEGFEPPSPYHLNELTVSNNIYGIKSDQVVVLDSKTILIKNFTYNIPGRDSNFWVGIGYQPSDKGTIVPDPYGYVNSLRSYKEEDVQLEIPGNLTVADIDWLSVYDIANKQNLAFITIPNRLNVPPALVSLIEHDTLLSNCEQLHRRLQVAWELYASQATFELTGQIGDDEYMAFGFSGSRNSSQMINGDAVVAFMDGAIAKTVDYNITAKSSCLNTLGKYSGVCRDELLGGISNFQILNAQTTDGVVSLSFRRPIISSDSGDKLITVDEDMYIIWAIGKLDHNLEPAFHYIYPKTDIKLNFSPTKQGSNNCWRFTALQKFEKKPWGPFFLSSPDQESFSAMLGPPGGDRGYLAISGFPPAPRVWYINGYLSPEIYLQRGKTYNFTIQGGNSPYQPENYHPFIITDEPHGGYLQLSEEARKSVKVLTGVTFSRRGQPQPVAAGNLCSWKSESIDLRLSDDFPTFQKFRNSLKLMCEEGDSFTLQFTPNTSWPDLVYYNSYTQPDMGGKIHVVDLLDNRPVVANGCASQYLLPTLLFFNILLVLEYVF